MTTLSPKQIPATSLDAPYQCPTSVPQHQQAASLIYKETNNRSQHQTGQTRLANKGKSLHLRKFDNNRFFVGARKP